MPIEPYAQGKSGVHSLCHAYAGRLLENTSNHIYIHRYLQRFGKSHYI